MNIYIYVNQEILTLGVIFMSDAGIVTCSALIIYNMKQQVPPGKCSYRLLPAIYESVLYALYTGKKAKDGFIVKHQSLFSWLHKFFPCAFKAHRKPSNSLGEKWSFYSWLGAQYTGIHQVPITAGWPEAFQSETFCPFLFNANDLTGGFDRATL